MVADTIKAFDISQSIMQGGFGRASGLTRQLTPSGVGNLLAQNAFRSIFWRHYDFGDTTIVTAPWTITKDSSATTFSESATASNGALTASTGTTDTDGLSIHTPRIFKGDLDCCMLVRARLDVVTAFTSEAGWIDTVSDKTTPVITDIDTPVVGSGAGDVAVLHIDTAATLTTYGLATVGSTPYTAATTTLLLPGAMRTTDTTTFTPTAATYYTIMVALNGDNVYSMIFDDSERPKAYAFKASGIEGGTAVSAWWALATKNTTAKVPLIDYITVFQNRF